MGEECAPSWIGFVVHGEVLPTSSSTERWAQPAAETQSTSAAGLLALRESDDDEDL